MTIAAQRKHVVQSLDILLYELHVLGFFLSPSIWILVFRLLSQSQCSKPRELDAAWSLRIFFALLVSLNAITVWNHATSGPSDGKTVILDFIGTGYTPSKSRLLLLDLLTVFLQMVLATIAFETSFAGGNDNTAGNLLTAVPDRTKPYPSRSPYVIDLSVRTFVAHLRRPLPPRMSGNSDLDGLPLPNTTPWPLPAVGLRMLLGVPRASPRPPSGRDGSEAGDGNTRIPGALDG
ncbi:hypothetical protein B0H15DRAFT_398747 [Mycena belliarum]|uniref:DUF1746 domain-containing protein n=1 Tax=Mycena belliarum TaxID=1033014 RepID=A0AAD6XP04_9AGAR|nr:hypothetical protein B0H15DRAFT_398747 [Mycena belliae]